MRDAVSLLSGGLDSAATTAIAVREGFRVHALTIAYGQRHGIEVDRAVRLAGSLGVVAHRVLSLDLAFLSGSALTDRSVAVPKGRAIAEIGDGIPSTYVPARNTLFLSLALAWAESLGARHLFVGVNALDYSGYPDCRPEFLDAFEAVANLGTRAGARGERFRVHAPLLRLGKAEIVRRAAELGVDVGTTISCYDPSPEGRPCGGCDACRLRARGFEEAGIADPALAG